MIVSKKNKTKLSWSLKKKQGPHPVTGFFLAAFMTTSYAYESPIHTFTIDDVQGGFDGSTYGSAGATQDNSIVCGAGGAPCPANAPAPIIDKQGVTLYPVDNEFGFHVVDFLGAAPKIRDRDYKEGFVGNITDGGNVIGIKISNSATDFYKVKPPLGTWCQGLGGNAVKCSTEHYTVMEHALSCNEVIPYKSANPISGIQALLTFPADLPIDSLPSTTALDCAKAGLDDYVKIIRGGSFTEERLTNSTPGSQIKANDNTTVLDDIAASSDYSVTLKDDGKPLYRWGGLIKRPNDIRLYARLALPAAWKQRDSSGQLPNIPIKSARLVVKHWITNNPNDQLRPEDLENEAATGRKPSYRIEGTGANEIWKSTKPCYEGDGDFIEGEEGSGDPEFIAAGTFFKNTPFSNKGIQWDSNNNPLPFSSDLVDGFTNAYYTSINRDPFEWSYDTNPDPLVQNFVGSLTPNDSLGTLVSGPRWRLRANKFGQDIPSLEIPATECSKPPFTSNNIKYEVGTSVTTVINLLDWKRGQTSPLSSSRGWVDVTANPFVTVAKTVNGIPVTSNGIPMTDDFDLAVYIKGDKKSTAVYSTQLIIDDGSLPPSAEADLEIERLRVPTNIKVNKTQSVTVSVENDDKNLTSATGTLSVKGTDGSSFTGTLKALAPGKKQNLSFSWVAPNTAQTVSWVATLTIGGKVVDTKTATTTVKSK